MGVAPLLLRPSPFRLASLLLADRGGTADASAFALADHRLIPHYPSPSPLAGVLRLVPPGSDSYITEKYAFEIGAILQEWGRHLQASPRDFAAWANGLDGAIQASSLQTAEEKVLRSACGIEVTRRHFGPALTPGREAFLDELRGWLGAVSRVETAEFEIYRIEETSAAPLEITLDIRYDLVAARVDGGREERVGSWHTLWRQDSSGAWKARRWEATSEILSVVQGPVFVDVTRQAMANVSSWEAQLSHGVDYWRTLLDGACGIDIYSNTGIAAGDFDNDGFDDLYICQPAGLPNRLYRNRGDGSFEDVTERAGVGVLDNTACALFADFENRGLQDLLVVCGSGPLLFLNQGDGTYSLKRDAFRFTRPPQGSFTHASVADYDRDGRLDIYLCTYMYYLGLDQYHYPAPYYDARNGPPNCLLHNEGSATFVERTDAAGMNVENNRYSFASAWGDSGSNGVPDLFIANDFGVSQLYRNNGDGTFTLDTQKAQVEDAGAGMSCCWCDFDNDGRQDVYVASMWEAAGQRVSEQKQFHEKAPESIRALYRRHALGNVLYRNRGDGTFENVGREAGVSMGRWSWCSDFWDFDHDGYSDLYVANGYISAPDREDMASFFWRQVVGRSPEDATPSPSYEQGWNAINELIRSDRTWHGYARNVMFANNGDGTFSEVSGPAGLDCIEDSRAFALADLDGDGRLEVALKNRNAPQLRILHNAMPKIGASVSFRLRGNKSNRDAIGTAVTVEAGALRQTKYLQAGSGFLSQHSKELFFGIGSQTSGVRAAVRWPSGQTQHFENLPLNHRIEIEEGATSFGAKPFQAAPPSWAHGGFAGPGSAGNGEKLPTASATWLAEPLRAPAFSLADHEGRTRSLQEFRGRVVLLYFWATEEQECLRQLRLLNQRLPALIRAGVEVLAVNVDQPSSAAAARSFAMRERLEFPVIFATQEVAGVYNILYRYVFDRHRDLPIPTSFLLDRDGMIVHIDQGYVDPERILRDVASMPATAEERMRLALPFSGHWYHGTIARNDFTYGVALFQHGYLDQAEDSFREVIAGNPENADAWYNLGTLNLRRGNLEQARHDLEKSATLRPDYPEAWNNLGMIAAQQGNGEEAIRDFQRSLQIRPDFATALLNLGNIYRRSGNLDEAEKSLGRALELEPDDPEVNYSLGMLRAQDNQLQQASEYLQKAISLRPDYAEAMNNLGVLYAQLQDYSKAEAQFRTCIRLVPNFDRSYLNLANLYATQSQKQEAREVLEDLLRVQPDNPRAKQALDMLQ